MIPLDPILMHKVVFFLGILNGVTGLILLSNCRCLPTSKLGNGLMKKGWYKRYYKYHCYLWWVFWPSVIIHVIFAIDLLGVPF